MLTLDFTEFPTLETKRLVLRKLSIDDLNEILFLRSDENILRFIGKEPAKDLNEAEDFLNRINKGIKENESILWGITLKDQTEKLIGTICYWNIGKQNYRAEIGYVLNPEYWRKGIMKEAIEKVLDYGFNEMKLHSVEARINVQNLPSALILETTGFIKEGHLKEEYFFRDKFYDSIIYSKLQ